MAPHLQFATLSISREGGISREEGLPLLGEIVKTIGTNNSLQSIHLLLPSQHMLDQILDELLGDPCAKIVQCSLRSVNILFRLLYYNNVLIFVCSSVSSPGMTNYGREDAVQVPQLPDKIIKTILDIHLRSYLSCISVESHDWQAKDYRKRCIDLMVVSRRFYVSPPSEFTRSLTKFIQILT